jgi:hypothetical protein
LLVLCLLLLGELKSWFIVGDRKTFCEIIGAVKIGVFLCDLIRLRDANLL